MELILSYTYATKCSYKQLFIEMLNNLELFEELGSSLSLLDLKDVETNGLGKGTALANSNDVTPKKFFWSA